MENKKLPKALDAIDFKILNELQRNGKILTLSFLNVLGYRLHLV